MEPENPRLEKRETFTNCKFLGSMLVLERVSPPPKGVMLNMGKLLVQTNAQSVERGPEYQQKGVNGG